MSLFKKIQYIKSQIVDTERLLEMVFDHPLMSEGFKEKLIDLHNQLELLPKVEYDTSIQLMFSGKAVIGSQGIKSSFLSKTLSPFQEMVKTQVALIRFGNNEKTSKNKKKVPTELYLTALPIGSFGVELTQIENFELFDNQDISNAMKQVITLIVDTATSDATFESSIEKTPKTNLKNLKKFLKEVADEQSILKMECGELGVELPKEKIFEAYNRVSTTIDEIKEDFISGIFRGLLLDSSRFEFQNEDGQKKSGFVSEQLSEEQLIDYDKTFLNSECIMHVRIHKTTFKTGNEKTEFELLEIKRSN